MLSKFSTVIFLGDFFLDAVNFPCYGVDGNVTKLKYKYKVCRSGSNLKVFFFQSPGLNYWLH